MNIIKQEREIRRIEKFFLLLNEKNTLKYISESYLTTYLIRIINFGTLAGLSF